MKKYPLVFKVSDVRRVLEHSISAPEQGPVSYTNDPVDCPSIVIVHDEGVYIMSNGIPGDFVEPDTGSPSRKRFCAYAKGCDPEKDQDFWENSRDLVGGDDFAETVQDAGQILGLILGNKNKRVIKFEMTEDTWEIKI
jgi:hypothetical protein